MTVRDAGYTVKQKQFVLPGMDRPVSLYWSWEKHPAGRKTVQGGLSLERRDDFYGPHWHNLAYIQIRFG